MTQAKTQYAYDLANYEITKRRADDQAKQNAINAILNYQQLQMREQEANEAAVTQKSEIAREIQKARAMVELGAMEGGVGGNVVTRAMADLGFTEAQKINAIEMSRSSAISQAEAEKVSTFYNAQVSPTYLVKPKAPKIGGMNFLSAALSGLGGFISGGGFDSGSITSQTSGFNRQSGYTKVSSIG